MIENEIAVMFRRPRFPVIVLSLKGLASALDRRQLFRILNAIQSSDSFPDAKIIEITGSEFWFDASKRYLAPGFSGRRWTKKQLIDIYNDTRRKQYAPRSLQNYKLDRIITDIALLLNKPDDL